MGSSDESSESKPGRRSKVARLLEEYDMHGTGDELEERWTAAEDRQSLRELAALFNQLLLERALEETGSQLLDGERENIYRLLSDDDVSSAERIRVRRRLEREGVDVEALESDFVTYQAIRTYLTEYRDATYQRPETDPVEREVSNSQQLRGRAVSVTEGKLESLRAGDTLTLGEFRVVVDIQVVCEDCNNQYEIVELLERGGCECERP